MAKINQITVKQQWAFLNAFDAKDGTFPSYIPVDLLRVAEGRCKDAFNDSTQAQTPYMFGAVISQAIENGYVERTQDGLKLTIAGKNYRDEVNAFIDKSRLKASVAALA